MHRYKVFRLRNLARLGNVGYTRKGWNSDFCLKVHLMSNSAGATMGKDVAVTDRRAGDGRASDRRGQQIDRRKTNVQVPQERRAGSERRQGERRRQVDPTTCERDYNDDEIEFMKSMDLYKRANRRPFPTWSEVLEVLRSLGYRKVEVATKLPGLPTDRFVTAGTH